jgi:penicillin V acylase-like amidase (Ntn superfamily)
MSTSGRAFIFAAVVALGATAADACTTVCFTHGSTPVVAYNYDFHSSDGLVLVNPRGLLKTSILDGKPHTWTARFGSLSFNQFGRDQPMTGINEQGVVVAQMWHSDGQYPGVDARPEVEVLEWIQLQLDTASSVGDVLKSARDVRIRSNAPVHFLVAGRSGGVAVIEFLDGNLRSRTGADLPVPVLTNSTYSDSLAYLRRYKGFGGDADVSGAISGERTSLSRFVIGAAGRAAETDGDPVLRAFATLENARQPGWTNWSIVYELGPLRAHFRTEEHATIRFVDLASFDFACQQPAKILDIDAKLEGDVSARFTPYSTAANLDLVTRSYRKVPFLMETPESKLQALARQPERSRCVGAGVSSSGRSTVK